MSDWFSGGGGTAIPTEEATSAGGPSPGSPGGAPSPTDSSSWKMPDWANMNNASDALKIVAQLQQISDRNKPGLPPASTGPQLLRGTPAAPMQPVTAQPVTRGGSSTSGAGGMNLLNLLQMLLRARR